jgi:homogentisate 1,2-dioxygenase
MRKRDLLMPAHEGQYARLAHADLPIGSYEREIGRDGFFGSATHMYHRNAPTAFKSITGSIRPRAFNPTVSDVRVPCPWMALEMFRSAHMRVRFWRSKDSMQHLVRNADGDDLIFVHDGSGDFFCDYGHLRFETGDYLMVPRGTIWRVELDTDADFLLIESTGAGYSFPDAGNVGRHAPVDLGALDRPRLDSAFRERQGPGDWEVRVKRSGEIGNICYSYNPLDAVGWKGDLYPIRLNIRDIRPLMSHRVHLPPSAHTTFVGNGFVVCTFVPRPFESDPGAMKIPFFHSNDDYDEILFSHRGMVGSRGKILGNGGFTFHPMGFTHGPHPEVLPLMFEPAGKTIESFIVMIDCKEPVTVPSLPAEVEIQAYDKSWEASVRFAPDAVEFPGDAVKETP